MSTPLLTYIDGLQNSIGNKMLQNCATGSLYSVADSYQTEIDAINNPLDDQIAYMQSAIGDKRLPSCLKDYSV